MKREKLPLANKIDSEIKEIENAVNQLTEYKGKPADYGIHVPPACMKKINDLQEDYLAESIKILLRQIRIKTRKFESL